MRCTQVQGNLQFEEPLNITHQHLLNDCTAGTVGGAGDTGGGSSVLQALTGEKTRWNDTNAV